MNRESFLEQEATTEILANVGSFCSECYSELLLNELIFYDMKAFRYLCSPCYDILSKTLNTDSSITEEEKSLFL